MGVGIGGGGSGRKLVGKVHPTAEPQLDARGCLETRIQNQESGLKDGRRCVCVCVTT